MGKPRRWSPPPRVSTAKKNCVGCHRPAVRNPNDLLCSLCWSGLPQPLKTAFSTASNQLGKRVAAREIFQHLASHSAAARSAGGTEQPS